MTDLVNNVPTGSALFPETLLTTPLSSPQQQALANPAPLSTPALPVPAVDVLGLAPTLGTTFDFDAINPAPTTGAPSLLSWDSLPLNAMDMDFGTFLDNNTQLQQQYDLNPSAPVAALHPDPNKWLSDDLFDLSVFGVTTNDPVNVSKSLDPTQFTFVSSSAPSSPVPSLEPVPAPAGTPPPLASPLSASDATVICSPQSFLSAASVPGSSLPVSPFSFLSQQHQQPSSRDALDQLFLNATANVPLSTTSSLLSTPSSAAAPTSTVVDDLAAILADLPDLEPTTSPSSCPVAPPPAKRPRRRAPANELPPIVHVPTPTADPSAAASTTLAIPTSTRKSKAKVASLPTLLEYPKDMIAHDAPILSNKRKRHTKRTASDADLDTSQDASNEVLPSDPSLVSDPAAAKRITNALSARRSRARKQAKLEFFESRVQELEAANAQLAAQVATLQAQLRAAGLAPAEDGGVGSSSALMS